MSINNKIDQAKKALDDINQALNDPENPVNDPRFAKFKEALLIAVDSLKIIASFPHAPKFPEGGLVTSSPQPPVHINIPKEWLEDLDTTDQDIIHQIRVNRAKRDQP